MQAIIQVFGKNGKNYSISCLKYGVKPGMILFLSSGEFYDCKGGEKIVMPVENDCTGSVRLHQTYYLEI